MTAANLRVIAFFCLLLGRPLRPEIDICQQKRAFLVPTDSRRTKINTCQTGVNQVPNTCRTQAEQASIRYRTRVSGTTKVEAGGDFSITPHSASPLMDSWSSKRPLFPPLEPTDDYSARNIPFPKITDPEAPPLRTERHVEHSIASPRRRLVVGLSRTLDRCPCCCQTGQRSPKRDARMTQWD